MLRFCSLCFAISKTGYITFKCCYPMKKEKERNLYNLISDYCFRNHSNTNIQMNPNQYLPPFKTRF